MFSFFKKQPEPPKKSIFTGYAPIDWEETLAKFPIGKTFSYLGIEMVVVDTTPFMQGISTDFYYSPPIYPKIHAEYADNQGVIHKKDFDLDIIKKLD